MNAMVIDEGNVGNVVIASVTVDGLIENENLEARYLNSFAVLMI